MFRVVKKCHNEFIYFAKHHKTNLSRIRIRIQSRSDPVFLGHPDADPDPKKMGQAHNTGHLKYKVGLG